MSLQFLSTVCLFFTLQLAGQVVTSGFKEHLSKYFEKASAEDKARCLELLTALDLSEAVTNHAPRPSSSLGYSSPHPPAASKKKHRHKRPQTAMATMVTRKEYFIYLSGKFMSSWRDNFPRKILFFLKI